MRLAHHFYEQSHGRTPPIVFLHAFPLHSRMWQRQFDHLKNGFKLVGLDLPGYGKSPIAEERVLSIAVFADDVIETLDPLGIQKAIFCGCSMGGYTIFQIWRQYRDRVAAMILCDTKAEADTAEGKKKRAEQIDRIRKHGPGFLPDFVVQNLLGEATRNSSPQVVEQVSAWAREAPASVVIRTLEALAGRPDSVDTLTDISVPALIVVGEQDGVTPPENSRRMHEKISGSELVEIPNAGHLSPYEAPEEANRAIERFLDRL